MKTNFLAENVKVNFLTENVSRTVIVIQCVISGSEFSNLHIFIVIPQVQAGKVTKFILILKPEIQYRNHNFTDQNRVPISETSGTFLRKWPLIFRVITLKLCKGR